jgi:uncharacterized protein (DUF4415 family)
MRKRSRDNDNPEVTAAQFAAARPATEVWPADLVQAFTAQQRRRGRQRTPTKQLVSLRLDRETLKAYRATGRGWQTRIDEDLAKAARRRAKRIA